MMSLESMWSTKVENEHLGDLWMTELFMGPERNERNLRESLKEKEKKGEKKNKEEK